MLTKIKQTTTRCRKDESTTVSRLKNIFSANLKTEFISMARAQNIQSVKCKHECSSNTVQVSVFKYF